MISVTDVNRDFLIRLSFSDSKETRLQGAGQLKKVVGDTMYQKMVKRAYSANSQKLTISLRRGTRYTFIYR